MVDEEIPYHLCCVLPLHHADLTATARHPTRQVATHKQLELELLELAEVAVARARPPLVLGLQSPIPRPAEESLERMLKPIPRLAQVRVADVRVGQVIDEGMKMDGGPPAEHHLVGKAVALADRKSVVEGKSVDLGGRR